MNDNPLFLNRAERRSIAKKHGIKAEPQPLQNIGDCPYCYEPVLVALGQSTLYRNGKPTHKACRS